jgi:hypothetical protein
MINRRMISRQKLQLFPVALGGIMAHKRVNTGFTHGIAPKVHLLSASAFEIEMRQLGLTMQTCLYSPQLREWCRRNKKHVYIPEWLLRKWHMSVD